MAPYNPLLSSNFHLEELQARPLPGPTVLEIKALKE
jgi:hypothetical protein